MNMYKDVIKYKIRILHDCHIKSRTVMKVKVIVEELQSGKLEIINMIHQLIYNGRMEFKFNLEL